jgi:hypothetical protein
MDQNKNAYTCGTCIFAAPVDEMAIEQAKEYIKCGGYTKETVRILKTETQILVVTK